MSQFQNWNVDHILTQGCMRCPKGATPDCKMIRWTSELQLLRKIILECNLDETVKWGQACYTYKTKNIALIHGFKSYCAVLFFKGYALHDPKKVLIQQTEHVQTARQFRFTKLNEIKSHKNYLIELLKSAITIEKEEKQITPPQQKSIEWPEELIQFFKSDSAFKTAFETLTPGRQRAYLIFFTAAKHASTRKERIIKYKTEIMQGKGMHDDYKKTNKK